MRRSADGAQLLRLPDLAMSAAELRATEELFLAEAIQRSLQPRLQGHAATGQSASHLVYQTGGFAYPPRLSGQRWSGI